MIEEEKNKRICVCGSNQRKEQHISSALILMVLIMDGREVGPGLSVASLLDPALFPDLSARSLAALGGRHTGGGRKVTVGCNSPSPQL